MKTFSLDEIWEIIDQLQQGDIIEVKFLDASHTRNVRKLTNKVIATYKKVLGRYIGVAYDKLYGREFIILSNLETDAEYIDIYSIPVGCVVRIEIIKPSKTLKETSDVGMPYLAAGKDVKLVMKSEGIGREWSGRD